MAIAESRERLLETDGFIVESSAGDLGWVEEVWIDEEGEPEALAVRTADGQHGLLLDDDVLTVDRENRWVVVPEDARLLELDTPRMSGGDRGPAPAASWATTGTFLDVTARPRHLWHVPFKPAEPRPPTGKKVTERPLWQGVAALLTTVALLVACTIALAYVMAHLLAGAAY
jgi:PRC-barrel domain protein